jgi:hypothetical protein
MIIVSQNKRVAVEAQSIRIMADVRPVMGADPTSVHMGYDIYVNETIRVAKYKSEARAQHEFDTILNKWANGEAKWYWMPYDDQS